MRKLTYFVAATVDGFIASPDSEHTMFIEGEDHGAWVLAREVDEHGRSALHVQPRDVLAGFQLIQSPAP